MEALGDESDLGVGGATVPAPYVRPEGDEVGEVVDQSGRRLDGGTQVMLADGGVAGGDDTSGGQDEGPFGTALEAPPGPFSGDGCSLTELAVAMRGPCRLIWTRRWLIAARSDAKAGSRKIRATSSVLASLS